MTWGVLNGWLIGALLLSGCAHNYIYSGILEAPDSQGKMREHLLYWNKTERRVWFDTAEGSVRLLTQCSFNTVAYDEQLDGIIFRARDDDKKVIGDVEPEIENRVCGRVLNVDKIKDLPDGKIQITVFCEDAPMDDLSTSKPYLKARMKPYEFPMSKRKVPNFSDEGNVPRRPECNTP